MVVIYVPKDDRWEKLGQGLGSLLGQWMGARGEQYMNQQISQMSQDPKYANNPQQLYMDAEARWPGHGGKSYLTSLDAGLKIAEAKYYSTRGATTDLDKEEKRLRIQKLQEEIDQAVKTDPIKAQNLALERDKLIREGDVETATAPARKQIPAATLKEKQQNIGAGEESQEGRDRLLKPPTPPPAQPETATPPKPQSSLGGQEPGEAGRQLAALSGDDEIPAGSQVDPVRAEAIARFGNIDKPLGALTRAFPQYAEASTGTATDALPPSVATPGPPPPAPGSAPATSGPSAVMPTLAPSVSPTTPPPAPVSRANGPPMVPGPNLTPPSPAQRALSPQAGTATAQLGPPPFGSPAPPPGAAFTGQPDSGLRPPQRTPQTPAGTQDQPLGMPAPGSEEYNRQAEAVKANMNQELQDALTSMGIKHPQEQLEVYNKIARSNRKNFDQIWQSATKEVLDRHAKQAEQGYTEAETERRAADTQAAEQYRFAQNQFREQFQFMETYGKPQMMKTEDVRHIAASLSVIETDKQFLSPRTATGGIGASWKDWLQQKNILQADPYWLNMSTAAHQQVVASATTGGGLAGGRWRTQNAEMVTPSELHQNFQNVMMVQSNAARDMAELQVIYWQYADKPGQEQNAQLAARAYNARKAEFEQADTLWWGKDVGPDGKTLTGPYHYFYMGTPVDKNLKEVPGGPQMLKDDARYKNRQTGEVTDGAGLNEKARAAGMIPDAYLRVYSWLPDRG